MRATQLLLASPRLLRKALNATKTLVPMKKGKVLTRIFGERNLRPAVIACVVTVVIGVVLISS